MSDQRFCMNHQDRLFKYKKLNFQQCPIQECQRQIPKIELLCQKCLEYGFDEGQQQINSQIYINSIEQFKEAVTESKTECDKILKQQQDIRLKLLGQLKKVEEDALQKLDTLFDDLMKFKTNIDKYDQMFQIKGQENKQNGTQYEFYQLTYDNLQKFLDGLQGKQPHELNNDAINFGNQIEDFLHNQDKSINNFKDMLKNDIIQIGKFNIDIFSQDESVRTFFGSLQYNQIIQSEKQSDGSSQIKNIFIPIRNQVMVNQSKQDSPVNELLQIKEENMIFTYKDKNQYQNKEKKGEFKVEVKANNGIVLIYEKLKYENNNLSQNVNRSYSCQVIFDGLEGELDDRKGEFYGTINPQTLQMDKGILTLRKKKFNQTHQFDGKFNLPDCFFKGIKKIIHQKNNKEICYQGNFDYKLKQQGKGCIWIPQQDNKNVLNYLGGFRDDKFDSQGIQSLCRQKCNKNTIFIGLVESGQQKQGEIFYLKEKSLQQLLDDFQIQEVDSQNYFKLIDQILEASKDEREKIDIKNDPICQIF